MNYIITEDKKSGYQFWSAVARTVINRQWVTISSAGKNNIYNTIRELNLSQNDRILVALDRVEGIEDIIDILLKFCNAIGVSIQFTSYYYIEEMFISYRNWHKRGFNLPSTGSDIDRAFKAVQDGIHNKGIYNPLKIKECQSFINKFSLQHSTKEHILTILLQQYTLKSTYRIGTKSISKCWLHDCCIEKIDSPVRKLCNINKNINKAEKLSHKIKDLYENSILSREIHKLK